VIALVGKVDGCKAGIFKASLLFAENSKTRIDGVTGEPVDLKRELLEIKAKRGIEMAAQAEQERKTAGPQPKEERIAPGARAKKDAAGTPLRYSFNPAIVTSAGCIGDFVRMKSLEEVAQRKSMADMIDTGCLVFLKGIYAVPFQPSENVTRGGRVFVNAIPLLDVQKMKQLGLNVIASLDLEDSIRRTLGLGTRPIAGFVPLDSLVPEQIVNDAIAGAKNEQDN